MGLVWFPGYSDEGVRRARPRLDDCIKFQTPAVCRCEGREESMMRVCAMLKRVTARVRATKFKSRSSAESAM